MDIEDARAKALTKLRELEDPDFPLELDPNEAPQERSWCWIFRYDSASFYETGNALDSVFSGPLIVNKDGSDVWVAGTALPLDEWLAKYAANHGYSDE